LELANKQLSRTTELANRDFASRDLLDQRVQAQRGALAASEQAKAAIRAAQLNLEFTHITAPFSGRVSNRRVSIDSLISGGSGSTNGTPLTSIVSVDPIHLDFDMGEADYLAFSREHAKQEGAVADKVEVALGDETEFPRQGMLDFVDNTGDGNLTITVTFPRDPCPRHRGAADYGSTTYMDHSNASTLLVYAEPGANSLAVEHEVLATVQELKKDFPAGVDSIIIYDPTIFIAKSVNEVVLTIFVAILLVVGVVFVFLQSWRATIIPVIAIPVSLVGTFTVLAAFGISLNNLSLFGLVLAVGIVVDDAIVVVENVERNMRAGMSPLEAAHRTMDEVGGALISIALTLCAVFVPSAFLSGISGLFFRQFAVTISASTVISCFVSLTLSPALCAVLFKPHYVHDDSYANLAQRLLHGAFDRFNRGFDRLSSGYGSLTRRLVRGVAIVLVVYGGLIGIAGVEFANTPTGFIPEQDQGYLISVVQLPPGATLDRTEIVLRGIDIILGTKGIEHVAPFAGLDATTFTVASNAGTIFSGLPSLYNHELPGVNANTVLADLRKRLSVIKDAFVLTIPPPPVQGLGSAGGFKMMLEDRAGLGSETLVKAAHALVAAANKDPDFAGVFTLFNTGSPSVYADIDRLKAEKVGLTPTDVFSTLQVYLGSQYVNDFNYLGRSYEVVVQGDGAFRRTTQDISRLKARNTAGEMVPIGTVAQLKDNTIPTACRATTCSLRPRSRAWRCRVSPPARRCIGWRNWLTTSCRGASRSNGPISPTSNSSAAPPPCSCSAWPPSSSSSFWSPSTRAGSCRWPSS
jgi:hydrophobe/amphiphile efflux-1 (HAE1) family protein